MIPLKLAECGEECIIRKIGGNAEIKKHLENLGFVAGGSVTVVSQSAGNLIVSVKGARVALGDSLADRIYI